MAKKKIIISGATSAIMNAVIDIMLLQDKYDITGITSKIGKNHRKDIKWVERNLTKSNNDYSFIKGVDIFIHAAAISNTYATKDYFKINLQSTKTFVDLANHYKVPNFVYISSVVACEKCGNYGLSKLLSENYIKSHFNSWLIIRPSVLYGYSEEAPIDSLIKKIASKKIIPCPVGDNISLIPLFYLDAAQIFYNTIFVEKITNHTKLILGPQAFNYKSLITEISKNLSKKVLIIPIPKLMMMMIKILIQLFGIKVGVYPDQVVRLYNTNKDIKTIENKKLLYLSEYLKRKH